MPSHVGHTQRLPAAREIILLVDDDPSIREVLGRVLTEEGYEVLAAPNGETAVVLAATHPVRLTLLDLNMPGQGGWTTFEKLVREDPLMGVIIITARHNQIFTALGAGVSALVEKPFDYPALLNTVRSVLGESTEVRQARTSGRLAEFHYLAAQPPRTPA